MDALVAALGDQASWRYIEFFAANIRDPNTRRAYACVQPVFRLVRGTRPDTRNHPAVRRGEWIEQLQENHGAAGVKQQLIAVRMMFNWLITGQVGGNDPRRTRIGRTRGPADGWRAFGRDDYTTCALTTDGVGPSSALSISSIERPRVSKPTNQKTSAAKPYQKARKSNAGKIASIVNFGLT